MPVALAVLAKFEAFSFPVLKIIPLFWYSVLPLFRVFQYPCLDTGDFLNSCETSGSLRLPCA